MILTARICLIAIVISCVSWAVPSARANEAPFAPINSKYGMIAKVLGGAAFVPCEDVPDTSEAECVRLRDFLGYAMWAIAAAVRDDPSNIGLGRLGRSDVAELRTYISPKLPGSPNSEDVLRVEGARIVDCLRADCSKILKFRTGSAAEWANLLDIAYKYYICLASPAAVGELDKFYKNSAIRMYGLHSYTKFDPARDDLIKTCPRLGVPDTVFEIGRLMLPGHTEF